MASTSAANAARLCAIACRQTTRLRPAPGTQFALLASSPARRAFNTSAVRFEDEPPATKESETAPKAEEPQSVEPQLDEVSVASKHKAGPTPEQIKLHQASMEDQLVKEAGYLDFPELVKGTISKKPNASGINRQNEQMLQMMSKGPRLNRQSYWYDAEDPETDPQDYGEDFEGDDMTSMAHGKLEEIREMRHYERQIVWEMPLLSKFAKPFEPPTEKHVLRWRYTTYMGDNHPAEKKVVVQFAPDDLKLSAVQTDKLKKLAGTRYDPGTDFIKMSCESYAHASQNKLYLANLVDSMIAAAKDPKDTFEDIPLDTRHYTAKIKPRFPKEWLLTEERKKELSTIRKAVAQLELKKEAEGLLIDGRTAIEQNLQAKMEKEQEKQKAEQAKLETADALKVPVKKSFSNQFKARR